MDVCAMMGPRAFYGLSLVLLATGGTPMVIGAVGSLVTRFPSGSLPASRPIPPEWRSLAYS